MWDKIIQRAKKKFDVYPSRYANYWASSEYEKAGGKWKTVNEESCGCPDCLCDDKCDCECCGDPIVEAEYKGRKVKLNKPIRQEKGEGGKFRVYVKNDKGNIVKVEFGDPNMEIKRDDPARRKSFRARHKCDNPGPKWKARYWSCYQWRAGADVEG